ncbi:MAG: hypothetical protein WC860_07395 [Candidatus Margulisiibacteriota bacterium]
MSKSIKDDYKKKINLNLVAYLNLPEKLQTQAYCVSHKQVPTIAQIEMAVQSYPIENEVGKRDQALMAFLILTGIRVEALSTIRIKHLFIDEEYLNQTPLEVDTKKGKQIHTWFFPVGDYFKEIVRNWYCYLVNTRKWDYDSPLFPKTDLCLDENAQFQRTTLSNEPWQSTTAIRDIVKKGFLNVDLPYYNPHIFRDTLVCLAYEVCKTPEEFKAWS